jgi:hypothetical protein
MSYKTYVSDGLWRPYILDGKPEIVWAAPYQNGA